uniref:DUF3048 domain-containing protein n=1 Tax=Clostridium sp. NkU-1 TaxID=1095009 RepID=UPI000B3197B6
MMKKVWFGFAGVILSAAFLSGCSRKYEKVWIPDQTLETSQAPETKEIKISSSESADDGTEANSGEYYTFEERTEKDGKIRSYLTGEMVDSAIGNRRPVAVMMSNDKEALPQYGLNRAGVVYEAPAEGG